MSDDAGQFNRSLFNRRFAAYQGPTAREQARIDWILQSLPQGSHTVLDVGCGCAALTNRLLEQGYSVTALDLTEAALRHAASTKVQGSVTSLPFVAAAFDLVVCAEVIEHLPERACRECLNELWRVARRHVLITVPDDEDLDANLVRCSRCGHVFNAWGHVARFDDGRVRALFAPPPVAVVAFEVTEHSYWPPLRYIRHHVLQTYGHADDLVCPQCFNDHIPSPPRSLAVKVLDRIDYYVGAQRRVGWRLAIWDKKAVAGECVTAPTARPDHSPASR